MASEASEDQIPIVRRFIWLFFALFLAGLAGVGAIAWRTEGGPVKELAAVLILCFLLTVCGAFGAGTISHQLHCDGRLRGFPLKLVWITTTGFCLLFILSCIGAVIWFIYRLVVGPSAG